MKELSIEEKAKAYDEALKVLHKYDGANIMFSQSLKEEMFPELAESDDEKIRKFIIEIFKDSQRNGVSQVIMLEQFDKIFAWLEKQGNLIVELQKTYVEIGRLVKENCYLKEKQGEQKSAEWGEEDEHLFQIVIDILDRENHLGNISHTDLIACVRKLKSLKPQSQWKPSKEQMSFLKGYAEEDMVLQSLYNDLKKLTE